MDCFNSFMLSLAKILSYLRHKMIFSTSSQKKSYSYLEWTKLFSSLSSETCHQNLKKNYSIFKTMSLLSTIIMTTCQFCSFSHDLDIWKSLQKVSSFQIMQIKDQRVALGYSGNYQ